MLWLFDHCTRDKRVQNVQDKSSRAWDILTFSQSPNLHLVCVSATYDTICSCTCCWKIVTTTAKSWSRNDTILPSAFTLKQQIQEVDLWGDTRWRWEGDREVANMKSKTSLAAIDNHSHHKCVQTPLGRPLHQFLPPPVAVSKGWVRLAMWRMNGVQQHTCTTLTAGGGTVGLVVAYR